MKIKPMNHEDRPWRQRSRGRLKQLNKYNRRMRRSELPRELSTIEEINTEAARLLLDPFAVR